MASGVYNRMKYNCMAGRMDVAGSGAHTIKCALLTSTHAFQADNETWGAISANECAATGNYTAGGQNLTGLSLTQDNTNDRAAFDAVDVTWSSSTITARFCALYDNSYAAKDLLCCIDFGQDYSSSNGDFTIQWHANGIVLLT